MHQGIHRCSQRGMSQPRGEKVQNGIRRGGGDKVRDEMLEREKEAVSNRPQTAMQRRVSDRALKSSIIYPRRTNKIYFLF